MFEYYTALRKRRGLPVLPIAIYLKVGLNGIGTDEYEEYFWELRPVRFEYLYIGLPALDSLEYLEKENRLGWALTSLMRIPKEQAIEFGAEALRRIADTVVPTALLGECVYAYLPGSDESKFNDLLVTEIRRS